MSKSSRILLLLIAIAGIGYLLYDFISAEQHASEIVTYEGSNSNWDVTTTFQSAGSETYEQTITITYKGDEDSLKIDEWSLESNRTSTSGGDFTLSETKTIESKETIRDLPVMPVSRLFTITANGQEERFELEPVTP